MPKGKQQVQGEKTPKPNHQLSNRSKYTGRTQKYVINYNGFLKNLRIVNDKLKNKYIVHSCESKYMYYSKTLSIITMLCIYKLNESKLQ